MPQRFRCSCRLPDLLCTVDNKEYVSGCYKHVHAVNGMLPSSVSFISILELDAHVLVVHFSWQGHRYESGIVSFICMLALLSMQNKPCIYSTFKCPRKCPTSGCAQDYPQPSPSPLSLVYATDTHSKLIRVDNSSVFPML